MSCEIALSNMQRMWDTIGIERQLPGGHDGQVWATRKGIEDRFHVRQKNSVLSVSSRTALGHTETPLIACLYLSREGKMVGA